MSVRHLVLTSSCLAAACTGVQREGRSPAYLVVGALEAASGATPSAFGGTLASDVVTTVTRRVDSDELQESTVFEDLARVEFALALKDPGGTAVATAPSTTNFITVTGYHVRFLRADGRNTPGLDVPYAFDGAVTLTVGVETRVATFVLVRSQAKQEAPLSALAVSPGAVLSTIAEITFYGADQAGRNVRVVGRIGVNFANWSDPEA
jgi:hypothetical protein